MKLELTAQSTCRHCAPTLQKHCLKTQHSSPSQVNKKPKRALPAYIFQLLKLLDTCLMYPGRLGKDRAQTEETFGHAGFIHLRHLHSHSAQMKRCWVMCGSIKRRENYTTHIIHDNRTVLYRSRTQHTPCHGHSREHYALTFLRPTPKNY